MRFPFLTIFLIFIIVLTIRLKSTDGREEKLEEKFWDKERRANFTRKKNIDDLDYVVFNPADFPLHEELDDVRVAEYIESLKNLEGQKILNCTGYSNTELKLKYGAANITKLSEYDANFTTLVRDTARLAEKYLLYSRIQGMEDVSIDNSGLTANKKTDKENSEIAMQLYNDAKLLLEYGVRIDSDVRLCYELLAQMYAKEGNLEAIQVLKEKAATLRSLSSAPIIRALDAILEGGSQ